MQGLELLVAAPNRQQAGFVHAAGGLDVHLHVFVLLAQAFGCLVHVFELLLLDDFELLAQVFGFLVCPLELILPDDFELLAPAFGFLFHAFELRLLEVEVLAPLEAPRGLSF